MKVLGFAAAALVGVGLGTYFILPAVGSAVLSSKAKARGLVAVAGKARIGLRGLWFDRLEVNSAANAAGGVGDGIGQPIRVARLGLTLGPVCVRWASLLGTPDVRVYGGRIDVVGTTDEILALREPNSGPTKPPSGARPSLAFEVGNLELTWRQRDGEPPLCSIVGLEAGRDSDVFMVGFRQAHCRSNVVSVDADRGRWVRGGAANAATADAATTDADAKRSWQATVERLRVELDAGGGLPKKTVIATNQTKDSSQDPSTKARPSDKTTTAASNSEAGLAEWVRSILTSSDVESRKKLEAVAAGSKLQVGEVSLRIVDDRQKLDLGPWQLRVERDASGIAADLSEGQGGDRAAFSGSFRLLTEARRSDIRMAIGPTTLARLGIANDDFGLKAVERSRVRLTANVKVDAKVPELVFETEGDLDGLAFRQPWLAKNEIDGVHANWGGTLEIDPARNRVKMGGLRVGVGNVSARLDGSMEFGTPGPELDFAFEIPLAACQDFFDALPTGLAPMLAGWRVDGTFGLKIKVSHQAKQPEQSTVKLSLDNHCKVKSVPIGVAPSKFDGPFVLEVEDESLIPQSISFGPGTWAWTPMNDISPYLESAVLVCEDGRFLHHSGFDTEALQNSIRENLRSGRFARGGSTISMQLAKNLYLRRDKTLSRKLQEAGLTLLLEQSLNKRRLLELYLNVIEYGPGIYGIGPAARYYFDTTPERLSLAQSFFLGSILPNPKAQHFGADGLLKPGWLKQLRYLMAIAAKRGHITEGELEAGLLEHPAFKVPGEPTSLPARRIIGGDVDEAEAELPLPVDE